MTAATDDRSMTEILADMKQRELDTARAVLEACAAVARKDVEKDETFSAYMADRFGPDARRTRSRGSWAATMRNLEQSWQRLHDRAHHALYNGYGHAGSIGGLWKDADDYRGEIIATVQSYGYGPELVVKLEAAIERLEQELAPLAEGAAEMRALRA